jgi:predicted KAP-like P-loop ATPase
VVGGVVLTYARYGWSDGAISYRDGYLGLLILGIALLGILSEAFPPRVSPRKDSPYVIDNPKGSSTTSELFESQKQIVKDIEYLFNNGKPSVFAVTGEWGVGKTYLLWRAISEVESNHTDIIWAEFQPWRYASEEALIRGFYHDIGDALAKEIPGIQRITSPLLETTDKFVRKHDGTGIVGTIVDLFRDITEPEKGPEEQIPEVLERECRRLVVVIDDVERSYKTEHIFRTLQLALIAKNIENVQVVFLYEKERIIKAGPDHLADSSGTGSTYLEKFIEREVFVPTPRPSELRQLFLAYMGAYQGSLGLNFDEEDLPDYMLNAIATPRSVIRLFNEFAAFRINTEGEN